MIRIKNCLYMLLAFSLLSCSEYRISKQLNEFRKVTITIPEDLLMVSGQSMGMLGAASDGLTLILYYDSLSCSTCQISHLSELQHLYDFSDSLGVSVMSIFSPKPEELETVINEVRIRDFPYPVFIDGTGTFREMNRTIPADSRFHSFLLDSERHPIYVGNPSSSNQLWDLYKEVIMYAKEVPVAD